MKLTPTPRISRTDDTINRGIDAALVMAVFVGVGYGLDRWLGTSPWLIITCTVVAALGIFTSLKYRYEEAMQRLETERREHARPSRSAR